jgi:2-haloacid dehalogenase
VALVTFDLFSALIDSRTGGAAALAGIAAGHGWEVPGTDLYDDWDARNKASQQDAGQWVPFAEHSRRALADCYADRGLVADPAVDVEVLLGSLPEWPLWPDVGTALPAVARSHRVGVLSNVDDELFRRTRAAALVEDDAVLTSERLRAYKPHPELYLRARDAGVAVHVPASARDTRGALEAGLTVVRVARPGHRVDPAGPAPRHEVADLGLLPAVLDTLVPGT